MSIRSTFRAMPRRSSVGADAVARAIAEQIAASAGSDAVVRNGSRGMFWLEPLVEVETAARTRRLRSGYGWSGCRPV